MTKEKKNSARISYLISKDVKEKLELYCKDTGKTATLAVETILDNYLTTYFDEKGKSNNREKEKRK